MVGIELVKDKNTKTPFLPTDRIGHLVTKKCQKQGLLIRPIGNVLVLLPPLCVDSRQSRKMVTILELSIQVIRKQLT